MNRYPYRTPPQWWSPKLSPGWVRFWRPLRRRKQLRDQRLLGVDVRGLEHVTSALERGCGVMVTPNHPGHADSYAMYEAADRSGGPWFFMTAWQVFGRYGRVMQQMLRHHGCFSVDREGTDRQALRQAIDVLKTKPRPLVIFPEGEVYHQNDRVTMFREGAAAIALAAARKGERPVVIVPCGLKYTYVDDPTPQLMDLMDRLEARIFWRPSPGLPLAERIYRFAEAILALKELEYLGSTSAAALPQRIETLAGHILGTLEQRHEVERAQPTTPERVKELRRRVIEKMEQDDVDATDRERLLDDLDDLHLVVQCFSYPGDYVRDRPSVERIAETLDKFEEDVLGAETASIRACRKATVQFGEPLDVDPQAKPREAVPVLTRTMEERVQSLLDELSAPANTAVHSS